jgi:prevent-host-death family protein
MNVINALEAKNQFGSLIDTAQAHPVQINKHGRAVAYVLSVEEYKRLHKSQKETLQKAILKANLEEAQDIEYQNELSLWEGTLKDGISD